MFVGRVGLHTREPPCFADPRWSLPVLLRSAAEGHPPTGHFEKEDEINTDNEEDLLRRCQYEEINTDNEQELLMVDSDLPEAPPELPEHLEVAEPARSRLPGLPWELLDFAEELCVPDSPEPAGPTSPTSPEPSWQAESVDEGDEDGDAESVDVDDGDAEDGCEIEMDSRAFGMEDFEETPPETPTAEVPPAAADEVSSMCLPEGASQISFSIGSSHSAEETPSVSACQEAPQHSPQTLEKESGPSHTRLDDLGSASEFEEDSEEDSSRSRSSRSRSPDPRRLMDHSPGGRCCVLRRADCRFTRSGGSWYCGVSHTDEGLPFECSVQREVPARERAALLQLCEEIDDSVSEVRHPTDARARARASDSIPAFFTQLCGQLRNYHFQLQEKRCVETMDRFAVVLELFSRAVQLLDVLAPSEDSVVAGLGGEASPCFRGLVCDRLNEALGMHGLIPLCIFWLSSASPLDDLDGEGPEALSRELSVHALMTLQLLLLWCPPSTVALPEETFIARRGYQAVFALALSLLADVEDDLPCDEICLERLTFALDILRLGLRSDAGIDSICSCHADGDEPTSITTLALQALQTLALAPGWEEAALEVVAGTLAAAVRLLAALLQIPPIARAADFDRVAISLRQALQFRPLSLPLTAALRDLLVGPSRPRRWFSLGREAASARKALRRAVHSHGVLAELASAATERVEDLMKSLRQKQEVSGGRVNVSCRQRGMRDVALASLQEAVVIGAFFDNVEEAVVAVYKKTSKLEEMSELQELRRALDKPINRAGTSPMADEPQHGWSCLSMLAPRRL